MFKVLLLLLVAAAAAAAADKPCKWAREDCFECVLRHIVDLNGDSKLDAVEIGAFKKKLLGRVGLAIYEVADFIHHGFVAEYTPAKILEHCGDGHGYLTRESWANTTQTCMRDCDKREYFMDLCTMLDYPTHKYHHHSDGYFLDPTRMPLKKA